MNELDYLNDILNSEKYLFELISNYIKNIDSDSYHDFLLGIFDDSDEIIRKLNKHIINDNLCGNEDDLLKYFNDKVNLLEVY